MDELNAQFDAWRIEVANPRVYATTRRVMGGAFVEEISALKRLPAISYSALLVVRRRVSNDGMIAVGSNFTLCRTPRSAGLLSYGITLLRCGLRGW